MTESTRKRREWDRHQWAGDDGEAGSVAEAEEARTEHATGTRWDKTQWVGEDASGQRPARQMREDMPEGEPGLSGYRHNPGVQHWAGRHSATSGQGK